MQIKVVNIRPEDIVEGNGKLTLGLIWTIILNFQVSVIKLRQQQEALARAAALSHHNNSSSDKNAVLFEASASSTAYFQHSTNNGAYSSTTSQSVVLQRQVNKLCLFFFNYLTLILCLPQAGVEKLLTLTKNINKKFAYYFFG